MGYDIIGDIHGQGHCLKALLGRMGYRISGGVYRHPGRRAIFLGDLIDRGRGQREVVGIVRAMVDSGAALCVMGNHEYNAIAYATPDPRGEGYLRVHSEKNNRQHQAFLEAYQDDPDEYREILDWFRTLPLWLDLDGLKAIHACWDRNEIERIMAFQKGGTLLGEELLQLSSRKGTWQYQAIETLLKGKEITLMKDATFTDKEGTNRHNIRVRWWDKRVTTYREAFMGPESARVHIPEDEIQGDHLVEYAHDAPPVFLGHYWLEGVPEPLAPNIGCLDYSVAKPGGKLVAYRWDGEQALAPEKFVWVEVDAVTDGILQ